MEYQSTTIATILDGINNTFFLPAIQRPFVWKAPQILFLIDSLMKDYPFGSFMFWQVDRSEMPQVICYGFLSDYWEDKPNPRARPSRNDVTLVLDGQQRMTSLLIAFTGVFRPRRPHYPNPNDWQQQSLYLDLLQDPVDASADGDSLKNTSYGLEFHGPTPPTNGVHRHWFKVANIMACSTEEKLSLLIAGINDRLHHGVVPYQRDLAAKNLTRLFEVVWKKSLINYCTDTTQSEDHILDMFVRANGGGTPLSKADLMMSMITSKWSAGNARETVEDFVKLINTQLGTGVRNKIKRDFVLKSCLMLLNLEVSYNVRNFTITAIENIENNWLNITSAIKTTFKVLNACGINEDNLASLNAVLPIVYYVYHQKYQPNSRFESGTIFEQNARRSMHRWLLNSLLVGAFGGNSDQTLSTARHTIRNHIINDVDGRFPESELYQALQDAGITSRVDNAFLERLMTVDYKRKKKEAILILSLLNRNPNLDLNNVEVDHIIPQAEADHDRLLGQNINLNRISVIEKACHCLGNLQLLSPAENNRKAGKTLSGWVKVMSDEFLIENMIPKGEDLYFATQLPEFVFAREQLIKRRLTEILE